MCGSTRQTLLPQSRQVRWSNTCSLDAFPIMYTRHLLCCVGPSHREHLPCILAGLEGFDTVDAAFFFTVTDLTADLSNLLSYSSANVLLRLLTTQLIDVRRIIQRAECPICYTLLVWAVKCSARHHTPQHRLTNTDMPTIRAGGTARWPAADMGGLHINTGGVSTWWRAAQLPGCAQHPAGNCAFSYYPGAIDDSF